MSRARLWLLAVLCLAALMRAIPALRRPLQVDEAYTLHVASLPVGQMLRVLRELDVHPPLFLLLLHTLTAIHVPDVALRMLMAALGVATVALLYAVVRLWHDERSAMIAGLFAALMPSLIFYDITIRMYGLFDCLALSSFALLSVLYVKFDLTTAQRRLAWSAWALSAALLVYTQYLGFTVLAAQLLYAAVVRRDGLSRSLAGIATALLLWLPQLNTFLYQQPRGGLAFPFYAHHELSALFELAGQATIAVQSHGADAYFVGWTSLIAWLWLVAALALALPGNVRSLSVWLVAPAALTLIYGTIAHKLLYVDRYYLLLALGLCALTGIAFGRLLARRASASLTCVVAALGLAVFAALYAFDPAYYTADWPAVAGLLHARANAGDLIVFDQGSPFFVLDRMGALTGHPMILVLRSGDVADVPRLSRPFHRVWLVLFQSGPVDPDATVLHVLASRYRLAGYWEYVKRLPAESTSVVFFQL